MRKCCLSRPQQRIFIGNEFIDANLKWLITTEDHAVIRLTSSMGISCVLHISPHIRGSIFEFRQGELSLSLTVENITVHDGEIVELVFGVN